MLPAWLTALAGKAWAWLALAGAVAAAAAVIFFRGKAEGERYVERKLEERERKARQVRRKVDRDVRGAGDDDIDDWLRPPGRRDG